MIDPVEQQLFFCFDQEFALRQHNHFKFDVPNLSNNKIDLLCSFVLIKITRDHIRSADINQKSADLIWCRLGDFNQAKTAD